MEGEEEKERIEFPTKTIPSILTCVTGANCILSTFIISGAFSHPVVSHHAGDALIDTNASRITHRDERMPELRILERNMGAAFDMCLRRRAIISIAMESQRAKRRGGCDRKSILSLRTLETRVSQRGNVTMKTSSSGEF